jgi:hypothetical protein
VNGTGGLQYPNCPWYYEDVDLTKQQLIRRRSLGYTNIDEALLSTAERREVGDHERTKRDYESLDQNIAADVINIKEFYMRLTLAATVRYADGETRNQKWDDDEGGLEEECVVTYAPATRKILRIVPLWRIHADGKRPHIMNWFNQLPFSIYGQGIQAKMRMLNAMTNSGFNQMVDSGTIANMPWYFYAPSVTGLLPEINGLIPGQGVPVNDPRGVVFPRFQSDQSFWLNLIGQVQQYAERDGNVSDFTIGRSPEQSSTKTARGTIALLQQGQIAFGRLATMMVLSYEEMFRAIHADYKRHAPDDLLFRVTNNKLGKSFFKQLRMSRDVLGQDVDFQFVLNPNRQQMQQTFQILFQLMMSIPYVAQNPRSVRALAKQLYDATGTKNFDDVFPEEMVQQVESEQQQQAQQQPSGKILESIAYKDLATPPTPEQAQLLAQVGIQAQSGQPQGIPQGGQAAQGPPPGPGGQPPMPQSPGPSMSPEDLQAMLEQGGQMQGGAEKPSEEDLGVSIQ